MDALAFAGAVVNDLPWEEAYPLTLQMPHHSRVSFDGKVSKVAYTKVPVTYIVTEKDLIISPEKQRAFIKTVEEAGGKVRVESLQSGHCPNWSVPEELVEVIVRNVEVE
jgi:pimeloyl-ACP methyl ester carboxylesterase